MSDIQVLTSDDFAVAQGLTPAGEDFIDAYTALDLTVLDAGSISIPLTGIWAFTVRAKEAGLAIAAGFGDDHE